MSSATKAAEAAESQPEPANSRPSRSVVVVVGLAALLLVFAFRTLLGWSPGRVVDEPLPFLYVPSHTSPAYIASLSAFFLLMRVPRLRLLAREPRPDPRGWFALVPGVAVFLWAVFVGAPDLQLLAFPLVVLGAASATLGSAFARTLLLPALFLLFAIPLPPVVVHYEAHALQWLTTVASTAIVQLLGFEAVRQGFMIYTEQRIFHVIETCSGLRIIETLASAAIAYGELMGLGRRDRIVLFLLAPWIGLVLNVARVLLVIFTAGDGPAGDHTAQGLIVIVVGVLSFALVEFALRRVLGPAALRRPPELVPSASSRPVPIVAAAAVLSVLGLLSAWTVVGPRFDPGGSVDWSITMPHRFENWRARSIDFDATHYGSVRFSRYLYREYKRKDDGIEVGVMIGLDDRRRRDQSALTPKTALPGSGWHELSRRPVHPDWTSSPVEEIIATRRGEVKLAYHWREGVRPLWVEAWRQFSGLAVSPARTDGAMLIFRVESSVDRSEGGLERARDRVERFAAMAHEGVEVGG